MSGDKWVMVAAVAAGVFLILRSASARNTSGHFTTDGQPIYFHEKDGIMYDQLGGVWA